MKIYCNICNKSGKCKNSKIAYIFKKTLGLSIVYSKWSHEYKKNFKTENQLKYKSSYIPIIANNIRVSEKI